MPSFLLTCSHVQHNTGNHNRMHAHQLSTPCAMQAAALQARNEWVNLPNAISAARALSGPGRRTHHRVAQSAACLSFGHVTHLGLLDSVAQAIMMW